MHVHVVYMCVNVHGDVRHSAVRILWRFRYLYCDVNAAVRLIDLTACMYVPAPAGLLEQQ